MLLVKYSMIAKELMKMDFGSQLLEFEEYI